MADIVDAKTRSRMMSGIRGKNTSPELIVRRFLHSNGIRFRLHVPGLPGKPDLVMPRYRSVVLVHGCFWHHHANCQLAYMPTSNRLFWKAKLLGNAERDRRNVSQLRRLGWRVKVIWECELANVKRLEHLLKWIRSSQARTSEESPK